MSAKSCKTHKEWYIGISDATRDYNIWNLIGDLKPYQYD